MVDGCIAGIRHSGVIEDRYVKALFDAGAYAEFILFASMFISVGWLKARFLLFLHVIPGL
ncbi:hypothetical protein SFMTTN_3080 [Sulfuriferula multivorans]|uniref:Uncharacterized protein n=2 Tax=Sulfuriferula multivorans TaxID=1559896 RepID=A0A401K026_9PROT|nr:hypothetical protein SFMTTN_3080 [Sulfuriferula multivorans]